MLKAICSKGLLWFIFRQSLFYKIGIV